MTQIFTPETAPQSGGCGRDAFQVSYRKWTNAASAAMRRAIRPNNGQSGQWRQEIARMGFSAEQAAEMNGEKQPQEETISQFDRLTQAGLAAIEQGALAEARIQFEAALQEAPNSPEAHKNLGLTLQGMGLPDEAEQCFRQSVALDATYWKGYANLALLFQSREDWPNALEAARQAVRLNPLDPILMNNVAQFHKLNGDDAGAELHFLKAIALAPYEVRIMAHYGNFLLERERLSEALFFLESAAERAGEDLSVSERMGLRNQAILACMAMEKHVREETLEAQVLAEKISRHFDVIFALNRQADPSEQLADEYLGFLYSQWGRACLTLKQYPQAISLLEAALTSSRQPEATHPEKALETPFLHHGLAYAYCQLRHYGEAERHILQYLSLDTPDREPVVFLLLVILEERGGFEHRKELSALLRDTDWAAMKALMQAAMRRPELSETLLPTLPEALESTAPLPSQPEAQPFSLPQIGASASPATDGQTPLNASPSPAQPTASQGLARAILAGNAADKSHSSSQAAANTTAASPLTPDTNGNVTGLARQILQQPADTERGDWQLVFSSRNSADSPTNPPATGLARQILGHVSLADGTTDLPQSVTRPESLSTPEYTTPIQTGSDTDPATQTGFNDRQPPAYQPKGLARDILGQS